MMMSKHGDEKHSVYIYIRVVDVGMRVMCCVYTVNISAEAKHQLDCLIEVGKWTTGKCNVAE